MAAAYNFPDDTLIAAISVDTTNSASPPFLGQSWAVTMTGNADLVPDNAMISSGDQVPVAVEQLTGSRIAAVDLDPAAKNGDEVVIVLPAYRKSSSGSIEQGTFVGLAFANGAWKPTTDATLLESQGAALRTLVEAWFLSGDTTYRDRARAVATKLFTAFWSEPARMFRGVAGGADDVVMTAERFAWLQQALRETYEGIWVPGDPNLDRSALEGTIARVNKLYLNGWDDLNGDQTVEKPGECLDARMQLGEQALTGEVADVSNGNIVTSGEDREGDCVLNIAFTGKAAVLGTVHFHAP